MSLRYVICGRPVGGRIRSLGARNFATRAMAAALAAGTTTVTPVGRIERGCGRLPERARNLALDIPAD